MTNSDDARIFLANPIHGNLQFFLERYYAEREREPRFSGAHPLFVQFQTLGRAVAGSTPFHTRRSQFDVSWSLGMGNWARVPWIACVDAREKTMTRNSLYVTYLFRQDMTGVYLTLTQGVAAFTEELPRREARMQMRTRAEALRNESFIVSLGQAGFSFENTLDLRTEAALGLDYEFGVIAHKLYSRDAIPLDNDLQADLAKALTAYETYLNLHNPSKPVAEPKESAPTPHPKSDMPRAFVSHSQADLAFCRPFVQGLLAHGIDVWYYERDLNDGVIRQIIEQELAARDHFIVVLSPAAIQSKWVSREWNAALDLEDEGKLATLLPVIAEPCAIPLMLRGYMRIQRPDGGALSPEEAAGRVIQILTHRQQN
ncbi:MAG TPA: DUF3578 domain-containing protein [Ktedonobacterales bacterium]